jgi:DNA-binding Xre family transcriptional regulator
MIRSRLEQLMLDYQAQKGHKVTLQQFSEEIGVSINFLQRIRTDQWQSIDRDKLWKLCRFFEVSPDQILWSPSEDWERDLEAGSKKL